ncbi:MAG TPA: hypothetical protein VG870_09670 [Chitinophagaceae bacterium]|nr:hypothetical protein [Chitinophagaceae bacterium]
MADLEIQLRTIQEKLQQLLRQYQALQKDNLRLQRELEACGQHNQQQQQTIERLRQQIEVLKISSGNWNEQDKKSFEKRINGYLREIDRCITLLSE